MLNAQCEQEDTKLRPIAVPDPDLRYQYDYTPGSIYDFYIASDIIDTEDIPVRSSTQPEIPTDIFQVSSRREVSPPVQRPLRQSKSRRALYAGLVPHRDKVRLSGAN